MQRTREGFDLGEGGPFPGPVETDNTYVCCVRETEGQEEGTHEALRCGESGCCKLEGSDEQLRLRPPRHPNLHLARLRL